MRTNLLLAIANLVKNPITNLGSHYKSMNRMNSMGDALEFYIRDIFCNSLNENDEKKKNEIYSQYFSYIGNQNNPPDLIIKGGDAIEVKKIGGLNSSIVLNSSYPKDKLFSNSPMITKTCRNCEKWDEKDIIYAIGVVNQNNLKVLWLIYGDCYAASKDIYERIKEKISSGINELSDVEFARTNELGRVNHVDPLGITYLRIRGMWGIDNPMKVFNYLVKFEKDTLFSINVLILKEKYLLFPKEDQKMIECLVDDNFSILDVKIKSPNNPAKLLDAKLITFRK